ncbi:C4-dicarboxylate ABC transporter substrate-binding protein [Spirochaetia bacterium]|nr:C4-dicarboxylate ABC transporter substrate-binding protein [Spirochaetia bacterium]
MKGSRILFVTLVLFLGLTLGAYAKGSSQQLRMATGGNTGTYYAFGSAVGQILTEKTKVPITIQSTGASKANIQLIAEGEVEIAIVQNDVMDYAYRGVDLFTGEQTLDFAAMAALYAEVCQVVVNPATGIQTIADLKGKNVSVGDAGSGVEFNAKQILAAYGISFNDINKQNLSFGASADALRDNKIDAFFCVAGAPTTAIVDLAIGKEIAILEIDDEHAQLLMRDYPFYTQFPVPANSYKGVTAPVNTLAVKATFIVSKKVSADTVYNLTKALLESKAEIQTAHAKGAELSVEYAVSGISVPFHPGAEKYFREIGAIK